MTYGSAAASDAFHPALRASQSAPRRERWAA